MQNKSANLHFSLEWRGVEIDGRYDRQPFNNRSDRVYLNGSQPLFADGDRYLVIWFGPLEDTLPADSLIALSELWLDEAAETRGLHPDDLKRRQLPLL